MHPANTGKDKSNKNAVIKIAHRYKLILFMEKLLVLILKILVMKLIAPAIEEKPAICKLKILRSTAPPEWANSALKGGYKVHPVPTPDSTIEEASNSNKDTGNNQKLKLFNLGKAMSGTPNMMGTNQLPKAPTNIGITIKNIIIKACAVTITL
jgi:hypothetical protein